MPILVGLVEDTNLHLKYLRSLGVYILFGIFL